MMLAIAAGGVYFALVFLAGFVLGTLRTLVLVPSLGEMAAVAVEIPAMLAIAWVVCGFVIRRLAVSGDFRARMAMGGVAFCLLMAAEMLLAWILFARPPAAHLANYARPEALLGLAAQIAFGLFPLARLRAGVAERGPTSS
ncbi:MAG TPA: hypothetical protein VLQ65_14840 [Saliniramus sp.]|nr:hypothetical protein [Saliniramus sp.]